MAAVHHAPLITGVIGAGKSTVADAIGGVLAAAGHVTADGPARGAGVVAHEVIALAWPADLRL